MLQGNADRNRVFGVRHKPRENMNIRFQPLTGLSICLRSQTSVRRSEVPCRHFIFQRGSHIDSETAVDFPNHSNEKEKRRPFSLGEKQAAQGGFYGSRCCVLLFIRAVAWWFPYRPKQARLREPAEDRARFFT